MRLGEALDAEQAQVELLLKRTGELQKALRQWSKACQEGTLPAREKAANLSVERARELLAPIAETAGSWSFDLREYLSSGHWREELHDVAVEQFGLTVLEEEEFLISSPVVVRTQVSRGALQIGKQAWSRLHPAVVAKELRRLRDGSQLRSATEILEALYGLWKHQGSTGILKLRPAYDLFCLTPGWRKDNPIVDFAQRLQVLHLAKESGEVKTTRDGRAFWFEAPTADPRARDVIDFVAENGARIRYYGIVFD